jgi:KDO2-lipid IV(A) lauroyltransferase
MNYISYLLTRFFISLFAIVPFWLLYIFADLVYVVVYKLIGYRVDVVRSNLRLCFPDKSEKELKQIEIDTYKNFSMITVESLKAFTMKKEDIFKRHFVKDHTITNDLYERFGGIIGEPAHFTNWEWGAMSSQQIKSQAVVFYKPLSNKYLDKYIKKNRSRFDSNLVSIKNTSRVFEATKDQKKHFVMASDQSPSNKNRAIWVDFFGIETAFLHGPEYYSRKYNYPVIYVDIQRIKKGWYELDFELITDDPNSLPEGEITQRYASILERKIRENPGNWLWTHRRWKMKK